MSCIMEISISPFEETDTADVIVRITAGAITLPKDALIVVVAPLAPTALTTPEAAIVATAELADVQVTLEVRSAVVPFE